MTALLWQGKHIVWRKCLLSGHAELYLSTETHLGIILANYLNMRMQIFCIPNSVPIHSRVKDTICTSLLYPRDTSTTQQKVLTGSPIHKSECLWRHYIRFILVPSVATFPGFVAWLYYSWQTHSHSPSKESHKISPSPIFYIHYKDIRSQGNTIMWQNEHMLFKSPLTPNYSPNTTKKHILHWVCRIHEIIYSISHF